MHASKVNTIAATGTYTYTYTVPVGVTALLHWAHIKYTSSADAGNRQVNMVIKDGSGNLVLDMHAGAVFAASLVRHLAFMQGIYRETSFIDGELQVSIPKDLALPAGYTITFADESGTASATDAMEVDFQYTDIS